jgi:hypothetical protein
MAEARTDELRARFVLDVPDVFVALNGAARLLGCARQTCSQIQFLNRIPVHPPHPRPLLHADHPSSSPIANDQATGLATPLTAKANAITHVKGPRVGRPGAEPWDPRRYG